jgi:hypothetical protein
MLMRGFGTIKSMLEWCRVKAVLVVVQRRRKEMKAIAANLLTGLWFLR